MPATLPNGACYAKRYKPGAGAVYSSRSSGSRSPSRSISSWSTSRARSRSPLIAAFIAFGVQPVCRALKRRGVPKALAITIVFVVLTIVIVVGLLVIVPLTIAQLQALATNAPAYVATVESWAHASQDWLQLHVPGLHVPQNAFDVGQLRGQSLSSLVTTSLTSAGAILIGAATAFFVAFSSIVLSFFFLLNDERITNAFISLFPAKRRLTARKLALEITETFGSFISGQVLVSAITGIVVTIVTALIGFKFR